METVVVDGKQQPIDPSAKSSMPHEETENDLQLLLAINEKK